MPRVPSRERIVECRNCGNGFFTRHSQGKFCSPKCSRVSERDSWRKYGEKNKDVRNKYHRDLYHANPQKTKDRVIRYLKTKRGKQVRKNKDKNMRKKFPEKYAARQEVLKALKRGELKKKPCEKCGDKKVHGHHTDYSRPLQVVWLCVKHHIEEHKKIIP